MSLDPARQPHWAADLPPLDLSGASRLRLRFTERLESFSTPGVTLNLLDQPIAAAATPPLRLRTALAVLGGLDDQALALASVFRTSEGSICVETLAPHRGAIGMVLVHREDQVAAWRLVPHQGAPRVATAEPTRDDRRSRTSALHDWRPDTACDTAIAPTTRAAAVQARPTPHQVAALLNAVAQESR